MYVLRCSDGSLYTGVTTDVTRRVAEHSHGKRGAKYTRAKRPVTLEIFWAYGQDKRAAYRGEARFKVLTRAAKLRFLAHPESWANAK